jgi:hypothetical protein
MKKFRIMTVITTVFLVNVITVDAQQQQFDSTPLDLVIPCGTHAGHEIGGTLFINGENQLEIVMDDPSWIVAEMNKGELISSTTRSGGLTKVDSKDSKASKKAGQELKKEIMTLYKTTIGQKGETLFNLDEVLISAKIIDEFGTVLKVLVRVSFNQTEEHYIPVINDVLIGCL